ncbi:MAG: hypothetical protein JWP91_2650 [Fibrobacteres bacterium]|nr:hypothetical protein [Fibrobacterota bacterium]
MEHQARQPHPARPGQHGKASGPVIVFVLFGTALLMWGIVLLVGLRQRESDRQGSGAAGSDSVTTPEDVRLWLKALPENWIKVSQVEGQGWVLYVPCYSSNGALTIRTRADSLPGLACEYCDSLGAYAVTGIRHTLGDSVWDLRLDPPAGSVRILPVNDTLLRNFPEAPFKDKLLLWTRPLAGGRTDSMVFVPKSQETEFETLRAEDENPEGCGGGGSDSAAAPD